MKVEYIMNTDERSNIYFEYRYQIDNVLQVYSSDKYDINELYDSGIAGLFQAIDSLEENEISDFKSLALFYIKSKINKRIIEKD